MPKYYVREAGVGTTTRQYDRAVEVLESMNISTKRDAAQSIIGLVDDPETAKQILARFKAEMPGNNWEIAVYPPRPEQVVKTVFALKGIGETGKTTTIGKLYELLLNKCPDVKIELEDPEDWRTKDEPKGDLQVVLVIGKIKIGIVSEGDPQSDMEEKLEQCVNLKCDLIICACRTRGDTKEAVEELEISGFEVRFIPKEKGGETELEQNVENEKAAEALFKEVQKLIEQ